MRILGIAGSLRKESYNKRLLAALGHLLPEGVEFNTEQIGDLPLFNEDLEVDYPAQARRLKDAIAQADGVIIATPEYSRSIPGVLKNAVDWASRPDGESSWDGKKVLVTGASGGGIGSALAQYDLKKALMHEGAFVSSQEVIVGKFEDRFDSAGNITDPKTEEILRKAAARFVEFVGR